MYAVYKRKTSTTKLKNLNLKLRRSRNSNKLEKEKHECDFIQSYKTRAKRAFNFNTELSASSNVLAFLSLHKYHITPSETAFQFSLN